MTTTSTIFVVTILGFLWTSASITTNHLIMASSSSTSSSSRLSSSSSTINVVGFATPTRQSRLGLQKKMVKWIHPMSLPTPSYDTINNQEAVVFGQWRRWRSSSPSLSRSSSSWSTTTQLHALLRPDWLRKACRVKQIQQRRNRAALESLSKTQNSNLSDGNSIGKLYQCCNPSTIVEDVDVDVDAMNSSTTTVINNGSNKVGKNISWREHQLNVYLNIPETESEACDQTNIMGRLRHGEIVRSMSTSEQRPSQQHQPQRKHVKGRASATTTIWIEHDKGGWSPTVVDGMTRLVPINEDNDDNDDTNTTWQ